MLNESKILVIEDIPDNLEVITDILTAQGYTIATAINGERALKRLQKYLPNLILLDVKMPGIDGFETCCRIKANAAWSQIPIIFLTVVNDTDNIVKGFALGAVDYIPKPFNHIELLARVKTHLQLQQMTLQTQQQALQERILRQIIETIHSSLDLNLILSRAATQIHQLMGAKNVLIYRYGLSTDSQIFITAGEHDEISSTTLLPEFCPECRAGSSHSPQSDIKKSESTHPAQRLSFSKSPASFTHNSCREFYLPLFQRDELWGSFVVCFPDDAILNETHETTLQVIAKQLEIAIRQSQLYYQLEQANAELTRLANLDGLTQLSNRRCFDLYLQQEWSRLQREQKPLSLIMIDIDYFKLYNDTYGHGQGDICLQAVARALRQVVKRPTDLIARYGGEEFVAILPNTDAEGALILAQQMQQAVAQLHIAHRTHSFSDHVTVSLGITTCIPTLEMSCSTCLDSVDQALYQAKAKGRDCYWVMGKA